jgi:proline racemase
MEEPVTELTLEAPAGIIRVWADVQGGKVKRVTFRGVPSFAVYLDRPVEVPTLGTVTVDVAYGGMFYVLTDASALGFRLVPDEGRDLVRVGEMVKVATREQLPVPHPDNPEINGPTIALLHGPPSRGDAHGKNTVVISTGVVDWSRPASWTGVLDRSPCGTGTCARMATLAARGRLSPGDQFVHEGILGTSFVGSVVERTRVGPYEAIVPTIGGQAWITGFGQYVLEPSDPFPDGFTVGDIWGQQGEMGSD